MPRVQAYEGVVQGGLVRPLDRRPLPEGAWVYIVVPAVNEATARRKAARWLAENVGNLAMPGPASPIKVAGRRVWRFPVFVASPFDDPFGPIGYVDVDVGSATVLADAHIAEELIQRGERLERVSLPAGG